jgi:nitrogen-specific signal transduction histidine kinase
MRETGGALDISVIRFGARDRERIKYYDLPDGEYAELIVKDTGHGIQPDIIERIFDPYFTTKGVGEGSGMGLAVVHGIVTAHNERSALKAPRQRHNYPNSLPVVNEQPEKENESSGTLFRGSERILIIDDEKSMLHCSPTSLKGLDTQ